MAASVRLFSLVVDANDPLALARFWAEALRWRITDVEADEVALEPDDGTGFDLLFGRVPERKDGLSRLHLDLTTSSLDDQRETVEHLLSLGATHLDVGQRPEEGHVVLADPEGNELCVIGPDNRFLAGCPRLGAVSCDGTRAVGVFWSQVLGWPLIWDQDEETAIRDPDGTGSIISWGGPPVREKHRKNRLHFDLAPPPDGDQAAEVERLLGLGATRVDIGQGEVPWVVLADPGGNELCVLTPR